MRWFFINLEIPHFELHLVRKLQNEVFPKISFNSILKFSANLTSCQKSEKFHILLFDNTRKTSFWVLTQKPQNMSFPQQKFCVNFKHICYYKFRQKVRNILSIGFSINSKNLILGQFAFFPKKIVQVSFKTLFCYNFMQKNF